MKAIIFDGEIKYIPNYPLPTPPEGEILVRVRRAGICNTDIEITKGYLDFHGVLGHEFVGELQDGTRVVADINTYDGTCPACRRGDTTHCQQRTSIGILNRDGAFAEYLSLPPINLHKIPDSVPDNQAIFVEPLAAALEITERLHIRPTQRVAVIGDGKLGLLCAQVLALTGCDLVCIGHHSEKLRILEKRGISTSQNTSELNNDFDIIVECTGNPSGLKLACQLLHPRGCLVLKSTFHGDQQVAMSAYVVNETTIIGSRCGPFPPALRLLEKGIIDVQSMIEAEYPLEKGVEAMRHASTHGSLKIIITMED